jgi:hypothetical protein
MQRILSLIVLAGFASPLAAQNLFRATLDGGQEVPPVVTSAGGWGTLILNPDTSVTYNVETWGLVGTMAHIHVAPIGVPGGILVTLTGGPTVWSGTSAPLGAASVVTLRTAGMYFNVHTVANPGGEIRGQILVSPVNFAASANGAQETPPNGSAATATGIFTVNADRTITYSVGSSGITATMAHIHTGPPGVAGGILFTLLPGPTAWSGITAAMTEAQFETFQAGGMYLNIHSMAFGGGEIRGQIFKVGESYGFGCDGGGVTDCKLSTSSTPMAGSSITVSITGGAPGGSGFLGISLSPDADLFGTCQRLIGLPTVATIPVGLNGVGASSFGLMLPALAADATAYLQFGGFSGGTLVYTSNAWALRVEVL